MNRLSNIVENNFRTAPFCHICELPESKGPPSFYWKISGPAHNSCNINYKISLIVPIIVFHNLVYDKNFIFIDLANSSADTISVVPANKENYIAFTKYMPNSSIKFRSMDFFRFLFSKLET